MTAVSFKSIFGYAPTVSSSAPGRVNLMGDHTDYNGGSVLHIAINNQTQVEAALRSDDLVRIWSQDYTKKVPASFTIGQETIRDSWLDYIQAVTFILQKNSYCISGFDLKLSTDIPIASGLSASAALEVAVFRALRELFDLSLDDIAIAQLAQKAEAEFMSAPAVIMDQMAASLADSHHALCINPRTLNFKQVPLPPDVELVIVDSGIASHHATGGYKDRRNECYKAAQLLNVEYLTDIPVQELSSIKMPPPLVNRVKYVVRENERVETTVQAMNNGNIENLGKLFFESHASLKDDFEVSMPAIDCLVNYSKEEKDIIGARLTGGGFGGAVVMLAYQGKGLKAASKIIEQAKKKYNFSPRIV